MHALTTTIEGKSTSKVSKNKTAANFLLEALAVDLRVLEDKRYDKVIGEGQVRAIEHTRFARFATRV